MWKNNNPSFCAGDNVWIRGCRDMLLSGVILFVEGDKASVLMDSREVIVNFEDILAREV